MCTAITLNSESFYFGRNLDYFHTFGENVVITPRKYKFLFRNGKYINDHYSEDICMQDMANMFGVTKNHFCPSSRYLLINSR